MTDLVNTNTEVKKHVGAIHVNGKLSLLQRKIANVLLWNAYDNLLHQEKHRIRIRDIALVVGFDSNDLGLLKTALRELATIRLEWNLLHEDGGEEWGVAPILAQATIRSGLCTYVYAPDIREKFYNPEIYARINLGIQRNISSGYALALYENCVRYRNVGSTGWIDLATFKALLGAENSKHYEVFKHFNSKILKPAIAVINKTSDILLTVEFKRQKRRIAALRIFVKENPQMSLFMQERSLTKIENTNVTQITDEILQRLLSYGLTQRSAEKIFSEYGADYIEQNLDVVERDYQAGKVENLPAYASSALKNDYRPKKSPYELEDEKKKSTDKARTDKAHQARERLDMLQKEFEAYRLQKIINGLSTSEMEDLKQRFLEMHKQEQFFQRWIKKGFDHKVVQSLFRAFAADDLLEEAGVGEFEDFVHERGEDVSTLKKAVGAASYARIWCTDIAE